MTDFFVSTSGDNTTGLSWAHAKTTPAAGFALMSAGDTIYFDNEVWPYGISDQIPSGISIGSPTRVRARTNHGATFSGVSAIAGIVAYILDKNYIEIEGIDFNAAHTRTVGFLIGTNTGGANPGSRYITLKNLAVYGCRAGTSAGITGNGTPGTSNQSSHITFDHVESYDHSGAVPQGSHGFYVPFKDSTWINCIAHNVSGWGFHEYANTPGGNGCDNNQFINCTAYSCGQYGFLIGSGDNNVAICPVIYDCGSTFGSGGVQMLYGTANRLLNPTIYRCGGRAVLVDSTTAAEITNAVYYANSPNIIEDLGTGTVLNTNQSSDPSFVNQIASPPNLHLQSSSTAINTGTNLSATFTTDCEGIAFGANFEKGAFAFAAAPPSPLIHVVGGFTASSKVYDASTSATVLTRTLTPDPAPDDVSLSGGSAAFSSKSVGASKTVTLTGAVLAGADAADYTLDSVATTTANITAKTLTVTGLTVNSKTYDGSTAGTLNTSGATLVGVVGGDSVTLSTVSAVVTFAIDDVASGIACTVTGLALAGVDGGNYTLTPPTGFSANITKRALTVTGITANNKTFDGNTNATINTSGAALVGAVAGDSVTLVTAGATGSFANPNVGTAKVVTINGLALTGTDAANYSLTAPTTTANITAVIEPPTDLHEPSVQPPPTTTPTTRAINGGRLEPPPTRDPIPVKGGGAMISDSKAWTTWLEQMTSTIAAVQAPLKELQDQNAALEARIAALEGD